MNKLTFDIALQKTASFVDQLPEEIRKKLLIIQDIFGRIRLAVDDTKSEQYQALDELKDQLGAYQSLGDFILYREDFFDANLIFNDSGIDTLSIRNPQNLEKNFQVRILNRQITGQDWLRFQQFTDENQIPRIVFYGFKGGVGRSTALAITAYLLAQSGKKVLILDLDLESPGISSMLLPSNQKPDYGIVDWFIEDAVDQGNGILQSLIANSPLAKNTIGQIRIATANGCYTDPNFYVAKLSRIYGDINKNDRIQTFSDRLKRLVSELEKQEQPDIILIDNRAGLHDISAAAIGLSTMTYMFATNAWQSWDGYQLLFSHWKNYPQKLNIIRDRIKMVYALFPKTEQEKRRTEFIENSYRLFLENIYENIPSKEEFDNDDAFQNEDAFSFDINWEDAPHFPVHIKWDERYVEFDSILIQSGTITGPELGIAYGQLFNNIEDLL